MGTTDRRAVSARTLERRSTLNNPVVPLSSDGILSVLGTGMTTDAGVNVSEMTALRLSVVWRCVTLIAQAIAAMPLRAYRPQLDAEGNIIARSLTPCPILEQPHPEFTPFDFWEMVFTHLLLWGNAFILKVPDGLGRTTRLLPIPPWKVSVRRASGGTVLQPGEKQYFILEPSGAKTSLPYLTDEEVLHIPGFGYDGVRGLSPIAHIRQGIGLGIAAEEFGARLFGSGSLIGGVLQSDKEIDQTRANELKASWRERITGLARAHEIAVLDSGLKFVPIALPPEDSQFLQSREFTVTDIARFYGVPVHLVNDVDKSTSWGAGIAEQSLGFVRYTLQSWMTRGEQRVTLGGILLPGLVAAFDPSDLLRGDTAARFAAYSVALSGRWITRNEVRGKEGLPPGPAELDEFDPPPGPAVTITPAPLPFQGKEPKGA